MDKRRMQAARSTTRRDGNDRDGAVLVSSAMQLSDPQPFGSPGGPPRAGAAGQPQHPGPVAFRRAGAWRLGQVLCPLGLHAPDAERCARRHALAVLFVVLGVAGGFAIEAATGKFSAFPFYAAVVASAWFGIGPGLLSFFLSVLAVAHLWTPARFSLDIEAGEWPSFLAFVVCALMSLAWSSQRRRAQHALEAMVQQRTADLVHANEALKAEMAEREAAENERKNTERALRDAESELARSLRIATMAEFTAAIAHEINQPLAAITANGAACVRSLKREPPLLDTACEAAGCIVADGHRAGEIIARIRALFNQEPPNQKLLNVNEIIRQVLELSLGAIERQRVTVRTELASPGPLVMADPVQLQQVLVNLVTNALEAMAEITDRPHVLTVRTEIDRGAAVAVTVEDNGSGLDPETVNQIFDSFYTTKPGGVGVGLAISRSIIDAHGGSIWAAPETPCGARIGFRLPLAAAAATGPQPVILHERVTGVSPTR